METVRKHYKNFQIQEGHFPQVHSLLGLMALKMSGKELICCLSFDEVSNKADISYDSTHDQVVGPYSNMNVMMVRGMFGNYKVPIWAGFDTDITKEDILTAIKVDDLQFRLEFIKRSSSTIIILAIKIVCISCIY